MSSSSLYRSVLVPSSFGSSPSSSSSLSIYRKSAVSGNSFSASAAGDVNHESGHPFLEMIQAHPTYRYVIRSPCNYEIKLVHGTTTNLHWYLLVRMQDSDLPYITIEVTTKTMTDLIQTTRTVSPDGGTWSELLSQNPSDLGTYEGTLYDLCRLADEVVADMGTYHLVSNNCQDFCNKLLKKLEIIHTSLPTTFHMDTTKSDHERSTFDCFSVVLHKVYDVAIKKAPGAVAAAGATVVAGFVGAPTSHDQRLNNFKRITKILAPLAPQWKEIGVKLSVGDVALNKIEAENGRIQQQCLREMLREYLLQVDSYEVLADVIEEYNHSLSTKIRHLRPHQQTPQLAIN